MNEGSDTQHERASKTLQASSDLTVGKGQHKPSSKRLFGETKANQRLFGRIANPFICTQAQERRDDEKATPENPIFIQEALPKNECYICGDRLERRYLDLATPVDQLKCSTDVGPNARQSLLHHCREKHHSIPGGMFYFLITPMVEVNHGEHEKVTVRMWAQECLRAGLKFNPMELSQVEYVNSEAVAICGGARAYNRKHLRILTQRKAFTRNGGNTPSFDIENVDKEAFVEDVDAVLRHLFLVFSRGNPFFDYQPKQERQMTTFIHRGRLHNRSGLFFQEGLTWDPLLPTVDWQPIRGLLDKRFVDYLLPPGDIRRKRRRPNKPKEGTKTNA